jgi:hypothetical protein
LIAFSNLSAFLCAFDVNIITILRAGTVSSLFFSTVFVLLTGESELQELQTAFCIGSLMDMHENLEQYDTRNEDKSACSLGPSEAEQDTSK